MSAPAPCPHSTCDIGSAMNGISRANGTTTTSAVRIVLTRVRASAASSRAAACAESRGRIAVARDTVMIECGTSATRNAEE